MSASPASSTWSSSPRSSCSRCSTTPKSGGPPTGRHRGPATAAAAGDAGAPRRPHHHDQARVLDGAHRVRARTPARLRARGAAVRMVRRVRGLRHTGGAPLGAPLRARDRSSGGRPLPLDPHHRDHLRRGHGRRVAGQPAAPPGGAAAFDRELCRPRHLSSRSPLAMGRDAPHRLRPHPRSVRGITQIERLSRLSADSAVACFARVGIEMKIGKRVLVVDDDASIRELLATALGEGGYEVVPATNVSVVALLVAIFVARAALGAGHYRSLLIAVGFFCMAGIFAVHGLSTPDVLQRGDKREDAGLVVGVSAQLALLTSALFFAIRYTPLAPLLERRVPARVLLAVVGAAVGLYTVVAIGWPAAFGGLARWVLVSGGAYANYDPSTYGRGDAPSDIYGGAGLVPYVLSGSVVVLFGFAAWAQGREYARSRLPMQGALAAAYVLLAQAQLSEFLGPVWTLSWWELHGLMISTSCLALV